MTTSDLDSLLWRQLRNKWEAERRELHDYCERQAAISAPEMEHIVQEQLRRAQLDAEEAEAAKKFLASQTE